MQARRWWMTLVAGLALVWLWGCGGFGQVNQGRVVAYEPEKGLLTLILDSNYREPGNPRYDVLPPVTVRVPEDPGAMGTAPDAGGLMELEVRNRRVVIFDAASQSLKTISCELLESREGGSGNDPRVAGVRFPVVDRAKRTVTVYLPSERRLVTFSVPEEYLALPESTWVAGDEVRYYFKDPGQALRLMNITKTEIK